MIRRISSTALSSTLPVPPPSLSQGKAPPAPRPSPPPSSPGGIIGRFGGPYALPLSELALGAWFAVVQAQHVADVVAPGPAQLWRAGGHGGAAWHTLAVMVGAGAALHGLVTLGKLLLKH